MVTIVLFLNLFKKNMQCISLQAKFIKTYYINFIYVYYKIHTYILMYVNRSKITTLQHTFELLAFNMVVISLLVRAITTHLML